jgi:hypothetical protein
VSDNSKAFDAAAEVVKQLITLATAVLALTVTFAKDITRNTMAHRTVLLIAWIVYLLSLAGGIWTLMALAGSLGQGEQSIYGWNIKLPAGFQIASFLLATLLIIVYEALALEVF